MMKVRSYSIRPKSDVQVWGKITTRTLVVMTTWMTCTAVPIIGAPALC